MITVGVSAMLNLWFDNHFSFCELKDAQIFIYMYDVSVRYEGRYSF